MKKFGTIRAAPIALMLTVATPAGAECGNLCDYNWWKTATTADVQAELDGDADVMARNKLSYTPLHSAARYGSSATVQPLLAAGADVMARDENGITSLHYASTPEVIQALLAAGAYVMARDEYGGTPLHAAARYGSPATVQDSLDAGADARAKDDGDKTPGDYAQNNEKLKNTKAFWALNDAQYN